MTISCDLRNTDSVTCVETVSGDDVNSPGSSTVVFTGDDVETNYVPVTITAGAAATGAPAPASASATATAASNTLSAGTQSSSTSTNAASTASASAAGTSLSSSGSTGGVAPQATGAIQWIAAGGAAALVLAGL